MIAGEIYQVAEDGLTLILLGSVTGNESDTSTITYTSVTRGAQPNDTGVPGYPGGPHKEV